ncbi:Mitogen-activated protein kinase 12, protein [Aphelenchoides fujianensis]|nr:Mitogen-activated protein kinase 12, protein [Aphelenchoides fujianensis]
MDEEERRRLEGYFGYVEGRAEDGLSKPFRDVTLLGSGGQAVVYSATARTKNRLAMKKYIVLNQNDIKKWENAYRELFLMQAVYHPNLLRLHTVFTPVETPSEFRDFYLVTLLEGRSLEEVIIAQKRFNIHRIWSFMEQLLDALGYLHEYGIIHRDLHTKNIVVYEEYHVKLIDYGLSTEDATNVDDARDLTTYVIAVHYRAPEVILGGKYTKAVDVWAAGCIFYELLTGKRLFEDENEADVFHKQAELLGMPSSDFLNQFKYTLNVESVACANIPTEVLLPSECFVNAYNDETLKLFNYPCLWFSADEEDATHHDYERNLRAAYARVGKKVPDVFEDLFSRRPALENEPWPRFTEWMSAERIAQINLRIKNDGLLLSKSFTLIIGPTDEVCVNDKIIKLTEEEVQPTKTSQSHVRKDTKPEEDCLNQSLSV